MKLIINNYFLLQLKIRSSQWWILSLFPSYTDQMLSISIFMQIIPNYYVITSYPILILCIHFKENFSPKNQFYNSLIQQFNKYRYPTFSVSDVKFVLKLEILFPDGHRSNIIWQNKLKLYLSFIAFLKN